LPDLLERANDDENTASVFADSRTESLLFTQAAPVRIGLGVKRLLRAIEAGKHTAARQ
jgi:hypothetical protein